MIKPVVTLSFLASVIAATSAFAQGRQDFELVNRTGYQIDEVYVGPVSSSNWGNDVMGKDSIADGDATNIRFSGKSSACKWDIKVVYNDGDESEFREVDLCSVSKVTLFWNKRAGTTRFVIE